MQTEKQRERLVELIRNADTYENLRSYDLYDLVHDAGGAEEFADYLMSNNVVVLPFEKGDIVYHLAHGYVEEEIVRCPYLQYLTNGYSFTEEDIGKTVFLSREEAENVLKERKENGK